MVLDVFTNVNSEVVLLQIRNTGTPSNVVPEPVPPIVVSGERITVIVALSFTILAFEWKSYGGIKSFQALEFKNKKVQLTIDGEIFYPVRYVHAEYDLGSNSFRHFDGAICPC